MSLVTRAYGKGQWRVYQYKSPDTHSGAKTYVGYVKRVAVTKPAKKNVYQAFNIKHQLIGQRDLFLPAANLLGK